MKVDKGLQNYIVIDTFEESAISRMITINYFNGLINGKYRDYSFESCAKYLSDLKMKSPL